MVSSIRLSKEHISKAAKVCMLAFENNPIWRYIIPDEKKRKTKGIAIWKFLIRYGVKYGDVFGTSENLEGVSLWYYSKNYNMNLFRQLKCGGFKILRKLGFKVVKKLGIIDKELSKIHHQISPFEHLHLAQLAVDPKYQGNGFSSRLLRDKFEINTLPIYLETSKKINVSIYQHFGFKLIEKIIIPDTDVVMFCMLRK